MTLTGIGPSWLYRSIFSLFSLTIKEKQDDETLTRAYICKHKTLLINRAGKHHRGFYPSSYPRNCSLVIYHILDTINLLHQSINLSGIFSLQFKYTNHSFLTIQFSLRIERRFVLSAGFGSICLLLSTDPPSMLQNVGPFSFTLTWQSLQFLFHSLLSSGKNVQKHPVARALLYFVLSPLTFCIPVGLTKHVHEYRIGFRSYWELSGCLAFETSKQQHPCNSATLRNPTHGNGNLWMAKSFVQFQFLIGCFSDILQMNMSM